MPGVGGREEMVREIAQLRDRIAALERDREVGTTQLLAGVCARPFIYFYDGTWCDEDQVNTVLYGTDNDIWHGEPGLEIAGPAGSPAGRREVYLRFENPVALPANRDATFVFFFTHWLDAAKDPSDIQFNLGLVTAAFSQATLEAMKWANKLASAEDHRMYRFFCQPDTVGEASLYGATNGTAPADTEDCSIVGIRVTPAARTVVTGVRLWFEQYVGDFAEGTAWIMNTLAASPHRSFVILE